MDADQSEALETICLKVCERRPGLLTRWQLFLKVGIRGRAYRAVAVASLLTVQLEQDNLLLEIGYEMETPPFRGTRQVDKGKLACDILIHML